MPDLAALVAVQRRAVELDVSTLEAAQTLRRPADHVDQDAALHAGEHPVWHLVLGGGLTKIRRLSLGLFSACWILNVILMYFAATDLLIDSCCGCTLTTAEPRFL